MCLKNTTFKGTKLNGHGYGCNHWDNNGLWCFIDPKWAKHDRHAKKSDRIKGLYWSTTPCK